jgi:hypothetical protein
MPPSQNFRRIHPTIGWKIAPLRTTVILLNPIAVEVTEGLLISLAKAKQRRLPEEAHPIRKKIK